MRNIHRIKSGGFTLVELIVVVGIIAVLVAMLLPALKKARDQAQLLDCLSRIRQCGAIAVGYYTDDYKGAMLPVVAAINGFPGTNMGYLVLSPGGNGYSSQAGSLFQVHWPDLIQMYAEPRNQRDNPNFREYSQILYCPNNERYINNPREGWWANLQWREMSWRMNYDVTPCGDPAPWGGFWPVIGRKITLVKDPARKVVLAETHQEACVGAWGFLTVDPPFGYGPNLLSETQKWSAPNLASQPRHRGGLVAAFFDGSARVVPFKERDAFVAPVVPPHTGATFGEGRHWDLEMP